MIEMPIEHFKQKDGSIIVSIRPKSKEHEEALLSKILHSLNNAEEINIKGAFIDQIWFKGNSPEKILKNLKKDFIVKLKEDLTKLEQELT